MHNKCGSKLFRHLVDMKTLENVFPPREAHDVTNVTVEGNYWKNNTTQMLINRSAFHEACILKKSRL